MEKDDEMQLIKKNVEMLISSKLIIIDSINIIDSYKIMFEHEQLSAKHEKMILDAYNELTVKS